MEAVLGSDAGRVGAAMTDHKPECFLSDRCSPDEPKHGFCGNSDFLWCMHCEKECICDRIKRAEDRVREAVGSSLISSVEAIRGAINTHYRIDCEPPGEVDWSQHRTCDLVDEILAAIDDQREKT